ncbi:site-specific DNA-methyltransferase [Providencia stuartii]|uniref:site-specific DNA-methyltransferase n=1 Tax=Providencia stuartii TaxID=588 RepID=UPI00370AE728
MDKLKMHSPDMTQQNIEKIQALFPNCVTEAKGANGELKLAIDFDQLKQELSNSIVEGPQERYQLNWPGKREALLTANAPIAKTLRPCREESVNFDTTENLFIEGDNLDALKMLQETYLGKVKMIYIDPPYNTGNDFIYEDDFSESTDEFLRKSNQRDQDSNRLYANSDASGRFHSDWLSMMYARLKLASILLRDDGIIFISIDDSEQANLKRICDEIFGQSNFLANIIWEKRFTRSNNSKTFATLTEHIICFRKSTILAEVKEPRNEKADSTYSNPDNDPRGVWTSVSYVNPATKDNRPNLAYNLVNPFTNQEVVHPTNAWKYEKSTYLKHLEENRLYWGKGGSNTYPRLKRFLSEMVGGMVPVNFWSRQDAGTTDEASKNLEKLMEAKVFDFPKPISLVQKAMRMGTGVNDIVLDFFAGSATTAHAVMQLNSEDGGNRKFIMVQLPEECDKKSEAFKAGYKTIAEISKERIRRAGSKILEGDCHKDWNKDVGFRVLKVDTSNMADVYYSPDQFTQGSLDLLVDNIKSDRTDEDLLFQVLLDWGVDLTLPIRKETIQGKTVFFVDDDALVACFDLRINEALIKELAIKEPLRVVFRDDGFESDAVKINAEQIFKQVSPHTEVKAI